MLLVFRRFGSNWRFEKGLAPRFRVYHLGPGNQGAKPYSIFRQTLHDKHDRHHNNHSDNGYGDNKK